KGLFVFTPDANSNGSASFTYHVTDTGDGPSAALSSDTRTVTITITPVNDPPIANADSKSTAEDTALSFPASDLTANDQPGPDTASYESGQTLTVVSVAATADTHGTVTLDAVTITYTPAPDYNGPASF